MAKKSGQGFIARNRAPRVQIEYDVFTDGVDVKTELPFVMGVLADLSGKPTEPLPALAQRNFADIDVDNFNEVLARAKPRIACSVDNLITEDGGTLNIEMTFDTFADFSPGAVARKVEPLQKLYEARTQLANLLTWMDGKSNAEQILSDALKNEPLLHALIAAAKPEQPNG